MAEVIPADAILALCEIGKIGELSDPTVLDYLNAVKPFESINRQHWETWKVASDAIATDDLIALTKGLVLAENFYNWCGGSVAAAIWTFQQVKYREPTLADELANWILPRTRNPWVPFGRNNYGVTTAEELRQVNQSRADRIAVGIAKEQEGRQRAEVERITQRDERRAAARDRNTPIRAKLIAELGSLSVAEQLMRLAADKTYSVEFYPTLIAEQATTEIIKKLDLATQLALCAKLKGKRQGPWRNFKGRLLSTFPNSPWNRKPWFDRA